MNGKNKIKRKLTDQYLCETRVFSMVRTKKKKKKTKKIWEMFAKWRSQTGLTEGKKKEITNQIYELLNGEN